MNRATSSTIDTKLLQTPLLLHSKSNGVLS
nr:MAG TPA: hypothetical protein [Caudoviricetes sp.]